MRREVAFGVLGQLISSGTNFGLQLALIGFAAKEDYGWYVLVMSYFYLGLGIQNAVVNTPLAVVLGKESLDRRREKIQLLSFWICCSAMLLGGLIALLSGSLIDGTLNGNSYVGLAFATFWIREFYRAAANSLGEIKKSTLLDLTNATLLAGGFLWLLTGKSVMHASNVFLLVGVTNLLTILPWLFDLKPRLGGFSHHIELGGHARWALPGVLVIWLQNNAYLSFAHVYWGAKLVADLGASRLWIVPLATMFTGWTRVFLSKASAWVAAENHSPILKQMIIVSQALVAAHLFLMLVFFFFANSDFEELLPASYRGLDMYVYGWIVFSLVVLCRGVTTQAIQAFGGFEYLFKMTLYSVVLVILGGLAALFFDTPLLLIAALIAAESFLLTCGWQNIKSRSTQNAGVRK